jgi:alpha-glucosidase
MYFNKYPYISNFDFIHASEVEVHGSDMTWSAPKFDPFTGESQETVNIRVHEFENDIYLIEAQCEAWLENHSQSELAFPPKKSDEGISRLALGKEGEFNLVSSDGEAIFSSVEGQSFGKSGEAHMFQFMKPEDTRCYGLGEKMLGLEVSNVKTKFWNTDVWADFDQAVFKDGHPDPMYVSVPYIAIKCKDHWVGLLEDNPHATFIRTNNSISIADQLDAQEQPDLESITIGSEKGQPRLVVIVAKTIAELTRKLQSVVGKTPLPPAWSLGYHQCRWGYESMDDLNYLDAGMNRNNIPCDGLWLDIDYMNEYRVFTFNDQHFPEPERNIAEIQSRGRKVVPIIDPGVKAEPGYSVYDSGKAGGHFCKNPQGKDFIGLVWPGQTVFPDYSDVDARTWWSEQVEGFAKLGFKGAWLDMNDPATGDSLNELMLFDKGKKDHSSFHNQYGMGMAKASREGFMKAHPNERPFLLSRSGCTGSSKYTAIWTGDNYANYHYLKSSIACSINLALSGIPFNGPDVAGFGGDTNKELMLDWIKCGFLFPILRNHSISDARSQEPWAFDQHTLEIYRHHVQLRYKCRLYLYNLFIDQAERGEAILKPLFYDFEAETANDLSRVDDQFMVGSAMMMSPFVEENITERDVILPSVRWFDTQHDLWVDGGTTILVKKEDHVNPLFLKDQSILPIARNQGSDHGFNSNEIDFHVVVSNIEGQSAETTYLFDDGTTYLYEQGERSALQLEASVQKNTLHITSRYLKDGFGRADLRLIIYDDFEQVYLNGEPLTCEATSFYWRSDRPCSGLKITTTSIR